MHNVTDGRVLIFPASSYGLRLWCGAHHVIIYFDGRRHQVIRHKRHIVFFTSPLNDLGTTDVGLFKYLV